MITNFETYVSPGAASSVAINVSIGLPRSTIGQTAPANIPLAGTGSLQFHYVSNTAGSKGNTRPASSLAWRGISRGELTTTVENYCDPQKPSGVYAFGLYCLADSADQTAGAGKCYAMAFHSSGHIIQILKFASGVTASNQTLSGVSVLASSTNNVWTSNTPYLAALRWRVSGTTVTLQAKFGPALSTLLSVVETVSAYISSVGEGQWTHSVTNQWLQIYYDSTKYATIP